MNNSKHSKAKKKQNRFKRSYDSISNVLNNDYTDDLKINAKDCGELLVDKNTVDYESKPNGNYSKASLSVSLNDASTNGDDDTVVCFTDTLIDADTQNRRGEHMSDESTFHNLSTEDEPSVSTKNKSNDDSHANSDPNCIQFLQCPPPVSLAAPTVHILLSDSYDMDYFVVNGLANGDADMLAATVPSSATDPNTRAHYEITWDDLQQLPYLYLNHQCREGNVEAHEAHGSVAFMTELTMPVLVSHSKMSIKPCDGADIHSSFTVEYTKQIYLCGETNN